MLETLHDLEIRPALIDTLISVGNKIDLIAGGETAIEELRMRLGRDGDDISLISCKSGFGLRPLIERIDASIKRLTGSRRRRFRLTPGSPAVTYLYANDLVADELPPEPSECGRYLHFDVLMNDQQMAHFQAHTGNRLRLRVTAAIAQEGGDIGQNGGEELIGNG